MRWTGGLLVLVVAVTVVAAPAQGLAFMQTHDHDPIIGCKILTVSVLPPGADVNEDCFEPAQEPNDESESSAPTNETQEDPA